MGNTLFEHLHQAGLANPRLTAEQDHLPHAISHMPPAFVKQGHFGVAPHERCQTVHRRHLKPMLYAAFLQHLISLDRRSDAFERMWPQVCDGEIPRTSWYVAHSSRPCWAWRGPRAGPPHWG